MLLSQKSNSSLGIRRKELPLQQYEKGDEITVLDSGIWQLYRGVVQLSRVRQNGNEVIIGWVTANGTFGNCFDTSPQPYRAIALCDVYVRRYSQTDVARYPLLAKQFLAQYSDRLIKSEQLLSIIAVRRVEERLKQLLLMLKQEVGQHTDSGNVRLQIRFTHQQLAEAICTTRVTVTRIIGDFQNKGLIFLDGDRHIVYKNL